MATRIEDLYEKDFFVWTQLQAQALRRLAETRPNVDLDFPHLIGPARRRAQPGASDHRTLSEAGVLPGPLPPRRRDSVIDARVELEDKLSPSRRRDQDSQRCPRL
jgi:hypothetical protein